MAFGGESLGGWEVYISFPALLHVMGRSEMRLGGTEQAPHILSLCVALVGDSKVAFHPELEEIHSLDLTCIHSTQNG